MVRSTEPRFAFHTPWWWPFCSEMQGTVQHPCCFGWMKVWFSVLASTRSVKTYTKQRILTQRISRCSCSFISHWWFFNVGTKARNSLRTRLLQVGMLFLFFRVLFFLNDSEYQGCIGGYLIFGKYSNVNYQVRAYKHMVTHRYSRDSLS